MNRVITIALAGVLLLAFTGPAGAYGGPPPEPEVTLPPAGEGDALAGGTTPCSTILISSDSWGPGTQVTAIRNDPGDPDAEQTDCSDDTDTTIGLTGTEDDASAGAFADGVDAPRPPAVQAGDAAGGADSGGSGSSASGGSAAGSLLGTATADDRGVLSLVIRVPADVRPGEFGYTLIGTAESGEVREVAERITIAPLVDDFAAVDSTVLQTTGVAVWQVLVGLVVVAALLMRFGGPLALRRRRA